MGEMTGNKYDKPLTPIHRITKIIFKRKTMNTHTVISEEGVEVAQVNDIPNKTLSLWNLFKRAV